jgi:hypothetical protein
MSIVQDVRVRVKIDPTTDRSVVVVFICLLLYYTPKQVKSQVNKPNTTKTHKKGLVEYWLQIHNHSAIFNLYEY